MANINYLLKNIKSNIVANLIWADSKDIIIITNSITTQSDLSLIEKYIKDIDIIQTNTILILHLSQSKSYLKILGILYINKTTGTSINLETVENIIWSMHVFNNICLIFKPHIIKIFSKSDMAIVWINIWDVQSGAKAKTLINRLFNVRSHFTTIWSTNINPKIS